MRIQVLTIFPDLFGPFLETSLIGRARERGLLEIGVHDLRAYTDDRHRSVDDEPYGGGGGMVMTAQPWLSAVRALTTLRCVDQEGDPFGGHKGSPDQRPPGTHPWFAAPQRAWSGQCRVLCGHWAALGLRVEDEVVALDSGCVWGRSLSAYRLEDGLVVSVPAEGEDLPG